MARRFLLSWILLSLISASAWADDKPNIVLVFMDNFGWGEPAMPRVYNLINDPYERDNVLFPNTWVLRTGLPQLEEHVASLKKHPPIPTGTPDPYTPN